MTLAHTIPFVPERDAEIFAAIPAVPGVFLLRGRDENAEPYLGKAANLRRRIERLLGSSMGGGVSKRLNLRERCVQIELTTTGSDFENVLMLYHAVREVFPESYSKRLKLNPSTLVRIHWENAYPRAYLTRKLSRLGGKSVYYGPFRSRAEGEKFLNDVLDLFKSRRCNFELHPDPGFPGCVYSEMKMCLAPCFQGCSDEEYMREVMRVRDFFESGGESLIRELTEQRAQASAELEFEAAAAVHARMEKVKAVARGCDEIVRRVDALDAIIMQPSARKDAVLLFRFAQGRIVGPATFVIQGMLPANEESGSSSLHPQPFMPEPVSESKPTERSKPVSLETRLKEAVESLEVGGKISAASFAGQLAILKRWYYRGSRVGEIFFRDPHGDWPMRRMVRGVSRVIVGQG